MSKPAIKGEALRKSYRTGALELRVLRGVDIEIGQGEFVSIQGESGCGKTTLLNLLAGLETPDDGQIWWGDEAIARWGRDRLARQRAGRIGIVFQSYHLVPEINALQNVFLGARIAKGATSGEDLKRAESLLARVGLGDRRSQMPSTLSGGERQRVAIARSMIAQPSVILADEPTGNLDERTGLAIMDLLQEICREAGAALVLVTHNPEHARRADRMLFLRDGSFCADPNLPNPDH